MPRLLQCRRTGRHLVASLCRRLPEAEVDADASVRPNLLAHVPTADLDRAAVQVGLMIPARGARAPGCSPAVSSSRKTHGSPERRAASSARWILSDCDHLLDRLARDAQLPGQIGLREAFGHQRVHQPAALSRKLSRRPGVFDRLFPDPLQLVEEFDMSR